MNKNITLLTNRDQIPSQTKSYIGWYVNKFVCATVTWLTHGGRQDIHVRKLARIGSDSIAYVIGNPFSEPMSSYDSMVKNCKLHILWSSDVNREWYIWHSIQMISNASYWYRFLLQTGKKTNKTWRMRSFWEFRIRESIFQMNRQFGDWNFRSHRETRISRYARKCIMKKFILAKLHPYIKVSGYCEFRL